MRFPFRTEHDFFYGTKKVKLRDFGAILARRQDCRFVHKRVKIGARKTGSALGDERELYILGKRFFVSVYQKYVFPVLSVRQVKRYPSVKSTRAQQRRVKHVGPVSRRHNNNFFVGFKA